MGLMCCPNNSLKESEDFMCQILKNPSLKLKDFDYNQLLNEIVSKRVQQEVYKEHIIEYLLEEFYNINLPEEEKKYSKSILEDLISTLNAKNNMYSVILIFYPFINHNNENCNETLFSIFNYITGRLTIESFENCLFKYFTLNTSLINNSVKKVCGDQKIKNQLEELNITYFNEDKIKSVIDRMLMDIKKNSKNFEKDLVSKEQFKEVYDNYPFASVQQIRTLVLNY